MLDFFSSGASATKSFARSRIFRYGLRNDILSRGQKNKAGGMGVQHPSSWFKGLRECPKSFVDLSLQFLIKPNLIGGGGAYYSMFI